MSPIEQPPARQLKLFLDVTFQLPAPGSVERLDIWLTEILEMPPPSEQPSQAAAWAWRALLLTRELLQIGQVPVFDPPAIISLAPDPAPAKWNARATLPLIETLPKALYAGLLTTAFRLCAWAAANPADAGEKNQFFAAIETVVRNRLKKIAANGKSTFYLLRAAHLLGIPFIHLGGGVYQLGQGSRGCRIDGAATVRDSAMGARLAGNKALTAALLRAGGLPAPVHETVATADAALAATVRLGWPVVVKPIALDRGEGVTTDVTDEAALRQAFATAGAGGGAVLVERQVPGVCHRLFVANGALLYAVKRWPVAVRGDGVRTVAELVATEVAAQQRRPPWRREPFPPLDEIAVRTMAGAGLLPASIPASGALVALRRIETTADGGVDEEVTSRVHPDNIKIALQAAELLSLSVAGVDVMSTDIAIPWHANGAIINEVNFAPLLGGYDISRHYLPEFLERLCPGNRRIPIEVFIGGPAAYTAAAGRCAALRAAGVAACLTSAVKTFSPGGEWTMTFDSLGTRLRALALSPATGGIVIAVQTDEFLHTGLPLDTVDALTWVDDDLATFGQPDLPLPAGRREALARLLADWGRLG